MPHKVSFPLAVPPVRRRNACELSFYCSLYMYACSVQSWMFNFMFSPSFVYLIIYNRITCMWLLVSGFCLSMYLSNCSPPLRAHLLNGDFFVGSSLATSLVKMVTRYSSQMTEEQSCNVRGSHDLMCDIIITSLGVCCRSHANDCQYPPPWSFSNTKEGRYFVVVFHDNYVLFSKSQKMMRNEWQSACEY